MAEAADGRRLRGINIKNGQQLRYLQNFLELLSEIRELERCALSSGTMMRRDQGAKSRAIDIAHVTHIQDDLLLAGGQHFLYLFTQGVALIAENNTPVKPHHSDAIHFAHIHFECHDSISFGWVRSGSSRSKHWPGAIGSPSQFR